MDEVCLPKQHGGMGFRDMSKFNVALLAKQGWHILTNLTSLLARVLKARYYPNTTFMGASLGSSPSYTWQSIYSARGLLESGIGWKVGTGHDISVWNDAWLPGRGSGRLNLPIDIRFPRVSDLICSESNTWNHGLLQSIFPHDIADRIGCIPLARSKPCDELIWRCENTGIYSPKSGYRVLLEMSLQQFPIHHDPSVTLKLSFCKLLWALNLPTKCKIFIWRLMHNFLPTFTNLQQRKLNVRNTCRFCESAADIAAHFVNTRQQQLIVITYWSLWYARNEFVHNGSTLSTVKVSSFILAFLRGLESSIAVMAPKQGIKSVKWSPPAGDIIKFNFDASFNAESKSSIFGIVARDCQGFIVVACTCPHFGISDAFIAEAVACDKVVTFALELGFRSVQIEGDSLSVIKKLCSAMADKSIISPILVDIKDSSKAFDIITFSFVSREGNAVAHELAKAGLQYSEPRYWVEEASVTVERLAQRDRPT
ncbi:hypothetical protein GQ457_15G008960 [Hibiscus cannabinus]